MKITNIPISEIMKPEDVNLSEELTKSIEKQGIPTPIVVTKINDKYQILNGRARYLAALSLGIDIIPCLVISETNTEDLESRIIPSKHSISVDSIDYAKGLKRALNNMTIEELAEKMDKSPEWIKNKLAILENK